MGNLPAFPPSSPPGALIYLLDLFCNSTHPQVRSQTAELFSKMTSDKLVGPKVRQYPCVEDHKERTYPSRDYFSTVPQMAPYSQFSE